MFKSRVEVISISEYFKRKCILITGASGFIGKVLIEKLLRSCPDVKSIYILIRKKKGKSPQERIKEITNLPLFDKIREQDVGALNKIIPIFGDTTQPDLGINDDNRNILISNVNVVYHCAASVRFDDHLKDAIIANVRCTKDLLNLIKQIKQLDVYIHVSTTFCNVDKKIIEEKIYPAHSDWRDAINIAENLKSNDNALAAMTQKFIHPFPNTYTYTKSLAEHTVEDLCKGSIPTVIYRPSIVVATFREPIPGWLDNFNGPFGLIVAAVKGVHTNFYADQEKIQDYVFVDNVAKSLITAAWKKAMTKDNRDEVTVYNASTDIEWRLDYFMKFSKRISWEVPFVNRIWYGGNCSLTSFWYYFYLRFIIVCLIPTLFIAGLLKLVGKQFVLLKLQRRIFSANTELTYFMINSWKFKNDRYRELDESLLESDRPAFQFYNKRPKTFEDLYEYCKEVLLGINKFLLHEAPANEETFRNTMRLYILDKAVKLIFCGVLLYWIFWKCEIISVIIRKILLF